MICISFFSYLFYKAKQESVKSGLIFYIVITYVSVVLNTLLGNPFNGAYFFRDYDFALGAIIGVIFALKYRKPNQSAIKNGILVGVGGGFISSIPITIFYWLIYINQFTIAIFFGYIAELCLTGGVLGFIIGGLLGWYYMSKEERVKRDEQYEKEFFQDLKED